MATLAVSALWGNGALNAQNAPGNSLLSNGSLETAVKDPQWPDGWGRAKTGGSWEVENGNHFLRLHAEHSDQMTMFYREVRIPAGTKALELKFRARVTGLKKGKSPWFDARIMMTFTNDARQPVKPGPGAPSFGKDTGGWVEKSIQFIVPEGATMIQLMPTLFKVETGTFDIDDLSLNPIGPEEPAAAAAKQAEAAKAKQEKQTAAAESKRNKAAANVQADGSLIPNGDFEASKNGQWPDAWGHLKTGGSWETEDGNHFIRMTSTQPGEMIMMYRPIDLPAGIKALELKWRQRVTNLKAGKLPWYDARIIMEFKDASGKSLPQKPSPWYTQKDTAGWVDRSGKFLVPENAATLILMPALFQVEKGTFDLDDLSLKPTEPGR